MSEAKKAGKMPATDEGDSMKYMTAGVHLVKVQEIYEGVNFKSGKPIIDGNNNPSHRIVFVNKAGETIDSIYFFSPLPIGDPGRKDETKMCKSEWRMKELKVTMGLPITKSVPIEEVKKKKLWIAVKLVETYTDETTPALNEKGNQKAYHEIFQIAALDLDKPNKGRPVIAGDPDTDADNFHTGKFYEKKITGVTSEKKSQETNKGAEISTDEEVAPTEEDDF